MIRTIILVLVLMTFKLSFAQNTNSTFVVKADTLSRSLTPKTKFTVKQLYIPSSLIITGLALNGNSLESPKNEIAEERNEHWSKFRTNVDDYLQYSPIAIAYGLDAVGLKSKNDIPNRTAILLKGELGMIAITQLLKNTTHIQRPDQSNYASFPSGHTAQAFAAATFLSEEYKDRYKWVPYVSYGIATTVGMLRITNNKHYISDVLVGAGIGYLSMKISYWTHLYKWNRINR